MELVIQSQRTPMAQSSITVALRMLDGPVSAFQASSSNADIKPFASSCTVKATARSPVPACVPSQRVRFHAGWTRVLFRASVSYASEGAYVNFMTEEEGDRVAPLTVPTMIATHRSKEYDPDNVPFKPEHQIIA